LAVSVPSLWRGYHFGRLSGRMLYAMPQGAKMNATERRELLHDLAYAEVQASELFDRLNNAACDTAADELAGAIARTISNWFARRLADSAESERIEGLIELIAKCFQSR
jgi:hypothetical protein